jgi:hypothetical protein
MPDRNIAYLILWLTQSQSHSQLASAGLELSSRRELPAHATTHLREAPSRSTWLSGRRNLVLQFAYDPEGPVDLCWVHRSVSSGMDQCIPSTE